MQLQDTTTTCSNTAHNRAWLAGVVRLMQFGTATFQVADGRVQASPEPRLRYSGIPRRTPAPQDRTSAGCRRPPPADPVGDFLKAIGALVGTWEVTLKIVEHGPAHWEYEEVGTPRKSVNN